MLKKNKLGQPLKKAFLLKRCLKFLGKKNYAFFGVIPSKKISIFVLKKRRIDVSRLVVKPHPPYRFFSITSFESCRPHPPYSCVASVKILTFFCFKQCLSLVDFNFGFVMHDNVLHSCKTVANQLLHVNNFHWHKLYHEYTLSPSLFQRDLTLMHD